MLTGPQTREMRVTDTAGEYRFTSVPEGSYEILASTPGFASVKRGGITVGAAGTVTVEPLTLAIAGMGETVVVSASRTESTVLDAPATISVVPASTLQALPSQSFADVLRTVPGMNVIQLSARDINLTAPAGNQHACHFAARPARRPFAVSRLLRSRHVGHGADGPGRHQADRGRARPGVGGLGRERAHRRRQHHHASRHARRRDRRR